MCYNDYILKKRAISFLKEGLSSHALALEAVGP